MSEQIRFPVGDLEVGRAVFEHIKARIDRELCASSRFGAYSYSFQIRADTAAQTIDYAIVVCMKDDPAPSLEVED